MGKIVLYLDLGERFEEARRFARDNPKLILADLLRTYPARFPKGESPSEEMMKLSLSSFTFQPMTLDEAESAKLDIATDSSLRNELDELWEQELAGELVRSPRYNEPSEYPETIGEPEAVHSAYRHEMDAIADYLRHGLSVLVACDKMLTEFIYESVCDQAGREAVLDSAQPEGAPSGGLGPQLDRAMQGGQSDPLANLPVLLHNLKPNQVLVLRSLDMLDTPSMIELLYQHTGKGEKPQLLAFLDPSLEVKKVLTDRFAVHVAIMGLPRHISPDGKDLVYTVTQLITHKEHACFDKYDPEALYKNVSGLNAIQFRNAMQYVAAKVGEYTNSREIYRVIRQFKTSSSDEIEIPDTNFEDIGGYEHVKQQLQRIVALTSGPIQGLDERQREQLIPRGFIFHGPPGTGKTLFAKAIANEMNATIQMISGPEIMDKYVGQSETNLRRIFVTARRNAPAVIFFDEFDSIASQRSTYSDGGARANNAVVAQFLTELDGFRQDQTVLVIGTTNRIDIIDEALLRPSRLRPMEIGLPDYAARKRVAEIHAKNFGVDKLLTDLCSLALKHLDKINSEESEDDNEEAQVHEEILRELFAQHPRYKTRYEMDEQRDGFLRELRNFLGFVNDCRMETDDESPQSTLLGKMTDRVIELGKHYGLDLSRDDLVELDSAEGVASLIPTMRTDIQDLFDMLDQERKKHAGLTPEGFLTAVMDLAAEYTEDFNNDEIRAIFQEASLEHHIEGQFVTPRYLGQKIGLIRKRRDEREAVHLSSQRGR